MNKYLITPGAYALGVSTLLCLSILFLGSRYYSGFQVEYGYSLNISGPNETSFYFYYLLLGGLSALLISKFVISLPLEKVSIPYPVENRNARSLRILGLAIFTLTSILIRQHVIQEAPMTDDENAYQQAALFLQNLGFYHLVGEENLGHLLANQFIVVEDNKIYSQYYPGFPIILAIADLLYLKNLINPLLSMLAIIGTYKTTQLLFHDKQLATFAAILLGLSPAFLYSSAMLMSHPLSTVLVVFGLYFFMSGCTKNQISRVVLGTTLIGLLLFTRPFTAICTSLAAIIYLAAYKDITNKTKITSLSISIILGAIFSGLFLLYNYHMTGDPFTTTYEAYKDYRGGRSSAFGIDPILQGQQLETLSLPLIRYNFWLLGWPISFIGIWFSKSSQGRNLCLAFFASTLIAYSFWPSVGVNIAGAFHYIEFSPYLIIVTAAGILELFRRKNQQLIGFMCGSFLVSTIVFYPWSINNLKGLADRNNIPEKFVTENVAGLAAVFVKGNINYANTWTYFRKYTDITFSDPIVWFNYTNAVNLNRICYDLNRLCYVYELELHNNNQFNITLTPLAEYEQKAEK